MSAGQYPDQPQGEPQAAPTQPQPQAQEPTQPQPQQDQPQTQEQPAKQSRSKRSSSATKTEAPVAAEAELDQRQADDSDVEKRLKDQAKTQRKQQKAELAAGNAMGGRGVKLKSPAEQRTGRRGEKPLNGLVDNMTQRDGSDALEGHFVVIDYSSKKVRDFVQNQLAPKGSPLEQQGFEVGSGSADYGVFLDVGQTDEDGYPEIARVFLRDEHAAIVNVPYDALRRSAAGGRR